MKRWTLLGMLAMLTLSAHAQLREAWRYRFPEQGSDQGAELRRALKLADGGLLLLGAVETLLNAYDAFAIKLRPDSVGWCWAHAAPSQAGWTRTFTSGLAPLNSSLALRGASMDP